MDCFLTLQIPNKYPNWFVIIHHFHQGKKSSKSRRKNFFSFVFKKWKQRIASFFITRRSFLWSGTTMSSNYPAYYRLQINDRSYDIKREYLIAFGVFFVLFFIVLVCLLRVEAKSSMSVALKATDKNADRDILVLFTTFSEPDVWAFPLPVGSHFPFHSKRIWILLMSKRILWLICPWWSMWFPFCSRIASTGLMNARTTKSTALLILSISISRRSRWILKTRMNSFKLPFFFGLFRSAIKHFPNVPFYGYINGDILVEQSITDVLFHVEEQIQTAALVNKVLSSGMQSWSRLLYILNETTFISMLKWICIPIWRTKIQNRFTIYLWNK